MSEDIRRDIIVRYNKAFKSGSDEAWKQYRRWLSKLAVKVNAISAEALEDWAFQSAATLGIRYN